MTPPDRTNPGPADAPAPPHAAARTRLAPSPTGALHLGNARTFLVNWALARRHGWAVTLRIEDLDTPRVKPGVIPQTIDTLAWLGLTWDEGPTIQSADLAPFVDAMRTLAHAGLVYPSDLTRGDIEHAASAPQEGVHEHRFPPELRPAGFSAGSTGAFAGDTADRNTNWRFATPAGAVAFVDALRGSVRVDPGSTVGDFLVWTKRGCPSYQLAVVVDDARQGVTHIVRGDDLLDSAARQLLLYRALGLTPEPWYAHLPLVRGADGRRLAKRHGDTRLTAYRERGVGPERIVGLCAHWCGLCPRGPEPMTAAEFAARFDLSTMPREDVVFTPEAEQWLVNGAA